MRKYLGKSLVILAIILIVAFPALAATYQKADLNGGNLVVVKVDQVAWNYDRGNIIQTIDVDVSGNIQQVDQDSVFLISDPANAGNITDTMRGINLIKVDLDQYAKNYGSEGNVFQGIDVEIENNIQQLDQDIIIIS